ncbi:MAG: phosphatase PAP2 family protein [Muribaculaceae bacterium]|nr:phosphatase PAP2 family protein [Muribaculaceae bacterium]
MNTSKDTNVTPVIDTLSHFFSWVFSPLLTPTYGIIAVFAFTPLRYAQAGSIATVISVIFALTGILPGLTVWLLTKFGDVSDLALTRRSDRLYPYIIITAAMIAAGFYMHVLKSPEWIPLFFWGAAAACVINFIINFKWKISAHGAGIGGLTALFAILTNYALPTIHVWIWLVIAIILCGVLAASRVWLGRHTPMQTIAGTLVGFLCVFFTELF